jgi:ferredoxin-NADP reductase
MRAALSGNGEPLTAALAGQFIVLRLRPGPDESALLRSYSLSGAPSEDRYCISVKREPHGAAGAYIDARVQAGDILDVSAPRGSFTLRQGERPVVLVSAGIGATPVLAMLHALAAEQTRREIWWIYGARNSSEGFVRITGIARKSEAEGRLARWLKLPTAATAFRQRSSSMRSSSTFASH